MITAPAGHVPVMLGHVTGLFAPALARDDAVVVDATLGRAGHARALLDAHPGLHLIGVDADPTAVERCRDLLSGYGDRVRIVHGRFEDLADIVAAVGWQPVRGVLFDLGVSSPQLDDPQRGFAYSHDAPLDMRMDRSRGRSAAEIVNTYSADDLARVLRRYGEERFAWRIADAIVAARSRAPVTSTGQLSEIVRASIPAAARRTGGHPAKRTFQALRIEVNDELTALARALPIACDLVSPGGRIVVLAYHSLEDRLVKRTFAARAANSTPPDLPTDLPGSAPRFRLLTRGALRPCAEEVAANPRAASARLRGLERLGDPAEGTV